jgi:hypothetical protein
MAFAMVSDSSNAAAGNFRWCRFLEAAEGALRDIALFLAEARVFRRWVSVVGVVGSASSPFDKWHTPFVWRAYPILVGELSTLGEPQFKYNLSSIPPVPKSLGREDTIIC